MKAFLVLAAFVLVSQPCNSRSLEESVVSVYTTNPTTAGTAPPLDVYRQIADNIAERITQPIYRFFGFTNTTEEKTTKRPFEHIELDSAENPTPSKNKSETELKTNEISPDRDVEEISIETKQKSDKKPEKITLFSSYLPVKENFEINNTSVEINDNSLELDDVDSDIDLPDEQETSRGGPFVYLLELVGSVIQLLWGGFLAIFKPSSSTD